LYEIVAARLADVSALAAIELAAARLLVGHAPEAVLRETTSEAELALAQRRGELWVALAQGRPVGFAQVDRLEGTAAHLKEIDVHPEHARRGLGRRLVATVSEWATAQGFSSITLTTFRDLPWNMPFYERLGFVEIPPTELGASLESILLDEARRGLDPARRVAMRRRLEIRERAGGEDAWPRQ
jgi:GNAT superfamily N-acetyltransferase